MLKFLFYGKIDYIESDITIKYMTYNVYDRIKHP